MPDSIKAAPPPRRGRPPSRKGDAGEVQSLDRAIGLLELLASGEGLTLSEVARRAELPSSTTHRLLSTLHRRGLVGHDAASGLWAVGAGLFRVGSAYLRIRKLPEIARPIIRALLLEVAETVNVSMLDQTELICVLQAESHAPVRAFFRLGRRLPIHASAAGKAILAAGTDDLRQYLLNGVPLEPFTPKTHDCRATLMDDVANVRAQGWAIDDEEYAEGMRCVSAAVLNEWSEPVGAVSISAPTVRMPARRLVLLGDRVRAAALTLSRLFSGQAVEPPAAGHTLR